MGQPASQVWHDIWGGVGPQLSQVVTTGAGFLTFDQRLVLQSGLASV